MTCCAGPLIALAGGASVISVITGIATHNPSMFIGGAVAFFLIPIGYIYYKRYQSNDKSI